MNINDCYLLPNITECDQGQNSSNHMTITFQYFDAIPNYIVQHYGNEYLCGPLIAMLNVLAIKQNIL
jgi:hypothetical protein